MSRPVIRVLRHMARSGGTVISKCLGSMDRVALLSEIHPAGVGQFNPVMQAVRWHGLLTQGEVKMWERTGRAMGFADAIGEIDARARRRGDALVIREWSHLDVIGRPFAPPTMREAMIEALSPRFDVVQAITVRHPVDQYLSLSRLGIMDGMGIDEYVRGCRVFAGWAAREGFVKYEDFTGDPDGALGTLCERLQLTFDPGYRDRWASYDKITGDTAKANVGREAAGAEIRALGRREIPAGVLDQFRANADYAKSLELLGYDDV